MSHLELTINHRSSHSHGSGGFRSRSIIRMDTLFVDILVIIFSHALFQCVDVFQDHLKECLPKGLLDSARDKGNGYNQKGWKSGDRNGNQGSRQREVGEKASEREKTGTVCIDQVGANCTNKTNKQLEEPSIGYACLQQAIWVGKGSPSTELHVSMNLLN